MIKEMPVMSTGRGGGNEAGDQSRTRLPCALCKLLQENSTSDPGHVPMWSDRPFTLRRFVLDCRRIEAPGRSVPMLPNLPRALQEIAYEREAQAYLASLPLEHFMEATPQAMQRAIT